MRYRFYLSRELRRVILPLRDFDIVSPPKPEWVPNWEFVYDFPDIRKNLALHVRLWMFHFAMWFIQKIGGKVSPPTPEYETTVDYVDVCTQKISDAIMLKLDEYHKQRAAREDIMIVVGASDFKEIPRIDEDFQFVMEIRYAQKVEDRNRLRTDYYLCGVPVFVLRDFDGIAVMPDFSKQTVRKLIDSRFN